MGTYRALGRTLCRLGAVLAAKLSLLGCVSPMLVKLVFAGADCVGCSTGTLMPLAALAMSWVSLSPTTSLLVNFDLQNNILAMGLVMAIVGTAHLLIPIAGTSENKQQS